MKSSKHIKMLKKKRKGKKKSFKKRNKEEQSTRDCVKSKTGLVQLLFNLLISQNIQRR